MDARPQGVTGRFWLVALFVLALRLPFLNLAVQGDDYYYLRAAAHAQIDPAHPLHARIVFLGDEIDLRGHPHPPGNAWMLAALLRLTGTVREPLYHGAYLLFSLLAAWCVWRLAGRFVPEARLWATLFFCAVPAFVVNGTSLETDLPHLAFWLAAVVCFVERRLALAALSLAAASLVAYQAVVLIPILGFYQWLHHRRERFGWAVLATPLLVIGGYQWFEYASSRQLPGQVLAGHMQTYALQTLAMKAKNAVALCGHLAVMVSPLGLWALLRRRHAFLQAWAVIYFAAALVLFFAGSARYLLPLAAPLALLTAAQARWRPAILAFQLAVGLSLAWSNAQQWNAYRAAASWLPSEPGSARVWVNAEWGLRHYAERAGARPVTRGAVLWPGDWLLTSDLADRIPFTAGGGQLVELRSAGVTPTLPVRLIGAGSGYSSVAYGLLPFGVSGEPADTIRLFRAVERKPVLSWLPMNAPEADFQIVSGVYSLESNQWRWAAARADFLLKPPPAPAALAAQVYVPDVAPGRTFRLYLDGRLVAEKTLSAPGQAVIEAPLATGERVTLAIDRDFQAPGDNRRLGFIVSAVGFRQ